MSVTIMNSVTPKAGAKHELLFNELASEQIVTKFIAVIKKLLIPQAAV